MIAAVLLLAMLAVEFSPGELALGEATAAQILKQFPVSGDGKARERVLRVAAKVAPNTPLRITTLSGDTDDSHEPLWGSGGFLFVPEDLLKYAEDESEIAAMLAHSIGHIAIDHDARMSGSMGGARGLGLAARRKYEPLADAFAVEVLRKAGYDPAALARFLKRVQVAAPSEEFRARLTQLAAH